jgi:bacteriocin leader peptide (microcyclamide/patellamide family)
MNKKNILPAQGAPVIRMTAGQLPSHLAELSEEALGGNGAEAATIPTICAYDGAEAATAVSFCAYDGAEAATAVSFCAFDAE